MRKSDKLWEIVVLRDREEYAAIVTMFRFPHTRPEMERAAARKSRAYRKWSKAASMEQGTDFPTFPGTLGQ